MAQGDSINDFFSVSPGATTTVSIPSGQTWRIEVAGNASRDNPGSWQTDASGDYGGKFSIFDGTNEFYPGASYGNPSDALAGKSHDDGNSQFDFFVGGGTFPLSSQYDMKFTAGTEETNMMGYMGVQTK